MADIGIASILSFVLFLLIDLFSLISLDIASVNTVHTLFYRVHRTSIEMRHISSLLQSCLSSYFLLIDLLSLVSQTERQLI